MVEHSNGSRVSKSWLIGAMGALVGVLLTVIGVLVMIGFADIKAQIGEVKTQMIEQAKKQQDVVERLVRVETKVDQLNPDVGPAINRNGGGR